jgi:hypothetical protein
MLIGFNLPLSGPTASPAMLARLAAEGEAIGYDYAAIIVEPTDIHARYPYTESGEFPASSRGERHEQLDGSSKRATLTTTRGGCRPAPRRPSHGDGADVDALKAAIEQLRAEVTKLETQKSSIEVIAAGHRADFEREREHSDKLMANTMSLGPFRRREGCRLPLRRGARGGYLLAPPDRSWRREAACIFGHCSILPALASFSVTAHSRCNHSWRALTG